MARHFNSGQCEKCIELMNEWGVDPILRKWFTYAQNKLPDLHISCAGRGKKSQEEALSKKVSQAAFGESPHNFTPALALDLFRLVIEEGKKPQASFNFEWYKTMVVPILPDTIVWGGYFKHFIDSPHFEVRGWKKLTNKILIWEKDMTNGTA